MAHSRARMVVLVRGPGYNYTRFHWYDQFCTNHRCVGDPGACCTSCKHIASGPHVYFLHVEKTGGSSVECATQKLVRAGMWTNMGHGSIRDARHCLAQHCPPGNTTKNVTQNVTVTTIRNPYSYWQSLFYYMRTEARKGHYGAVKAPAGLAHFGASNHVANWTAEDFNTLIRWANESRSGIGPTLRLTPKLSRACGSPCKADVVLRGENLQDDLEPVWSLLGVRRITLPHENTMSASDKDPPVQWDADALDRVWWMERSIFQQFNYTRRTY